jgi:hypothetical protein
VSYGRSTLLQQLDCIDCVFERLRAEYTRGCLNGVCRIGVEPGGNCLPGAVDGDDGGLLVSGEGAGGSGGGEVMATARRQAFRSIYSK